MQSQRPTKKSRQRSSNIRFVHKHPHKQHSKQLSTTTTASPTSLPFTTDNLISPPPSQSTSLNTSKLPPPPIRPHSAKQHMVQFVKNRISTPPNEFLYGTTARYEGKHVQMIADCLRDGDGVQPWEHLKGTFAHPGLIFFLNLPQQENKYQYLSLPNSSVVPKLTGIQTVDGGQFDVFQNGYGHHAVIGGKIIWGEPISVHNQSLSIQQYPDPPPEFKQRKNRQSFTQTTSNIQQTDTTTTDTKVTTTDTHTAPSFQSTTRDPTSSSTMTQHNPTQQQQLPRSNDFLLLKTATAVANRDFTKALVYKEEFHAFFPTTTNALKPSVTEANNYNNQVTRYNDAVRCLVESYEKQQEVENKQNDEDNTTTPPATTDQSNTLTTTTNNDKLIDTASKLGVKFVSPITTDDIQDVLLSNQLSIPNDQVEEIRRELNDIYTQLHLEMVASQKPFLTELSLKQQYGYLYSSLGSILKRRFKKSLQYDWKWSNQTISLETIQQFNANTYNNNLLLHDVNYAQSQGFNSTLISPHLFAFYLIDYLGTISQDTTPSQPQMWKLFERKILDLSKEKSKIAYKVYKDAGKTQLQYQQQLDEQQLKEKEQGEHKDKENQQENNQNGQVIDINNEVNNDTLDSNDIVNDSTSTTTPTATDDPTSTRTDPHLIKQRLLRENTQQLDNADYKNLLKQRLEIQPWHTIYQQLSSFEYFQRRPFPAPQPSSSTVTNTDVKIDENGQQIQTTTTVTKTQEIVFDVFAKVMTEHELLRRQSYHSKIRNKVLAAEQQNSTKTMKNNKNRTNSDRIGIHDMNDDKSLSKADTMIKNATNAINNLEKNHFTEIVTASPQSNISSYDTNELPLDPDSTVFLSDLTRSGEMKVKIWIEGKPLVTTTITTTTQWPKMSLPIIDDENSDDDLDIFNKTKQLEREQRKEEKKLQQLQRQMELERAQKVLDDTTNTNDTNDIQLQQQKQKTIDEEYQYPTTNFQVTNTVVENPDLESHSIDTPIMTKTIDQVHNTIEITQEQFQQGTVYFEGFATFSSPVLNICGLNRNELEQILIDMQSTTFKPTKM